MSLSSNQISQKEYLKKYLSGDEKKKRKKKSVSISNIKRSRIIDDDIDLKSMRPLEDDEVELYQMDEDAPQIAGIIDERPPEVKAQEYYSSKRWKVFGADDGVNVVDNMDNKHENSPNKISIPSTNLEKSGHSNQKPNFQRKMEDISNDDLVKIKLNKGKSKKKNETSSDDDFSPTCKGKSKKSSSAYPSKSKYDDSDHSPPRHEKSPTSEVDSDMSPPRKDKNNFIKDKNDSNSSQWRKQQSKKYDKYHNDSGKSCQRKEHEKNSPKYSNRYHENERSRLRKRSNSHSPSQTYKVKNNSSDSDNLPPRREKSNKQEKYLVSHDSLSQKRDKYKLDKTFHRIARGSSSGSKNHPQPGEMRKSVNSKDYKRGSLNCDKKNSNVTEKASKGTPPMLSKKEISAEKHFSDSDNSPPRIRGSTRCQHNESDSDLSPPRKNLSMRGDKPVKKPLYKPDPDSSSEDLSNSKNNKMKRTLDGKQAGLQDAKQLKKELSALRMKEDFMFSKMDASVSGAGAAPVKRDRKTGQIRDLEKEEEAQKEKEAKDSVVNEKYYKWGRGIKQTEDAAVRAAEIMKEMNKPLARYVDDKDLDDFLKKQEREGDPMLDYIRRKQSEATPLDGEKPIYKGSWNPNRFNIRPGYRWDGVVRSNGYEKEWFKVQNAKKARDEEAYKWSTSDM